MIVDEWWLIQEKADQGAADEVSENVDSKREVMHGEKNDWLFFRRSEKVDEQEYQTTDEGQVLSKVQRKSKFYR